MADARIFFMLAYQSRPDPSPVMVQTLERLSRLAQVTVGFAEESVLSAEELADRYHLFVLKSRSPTWTSAAAALHHRGARIIDPYPARVLLGDKAATMEALRRAGLPAPRTWIAGNLPALAALLAEHPLILKPNPGARGPGVRVVRDAVELRSLTAPGGLDPGRTPLIAQEYIEHDTPDLKVYVIGEHTWSVRKRFSPGSHHDPGVPCALDPRARRIALGCGRSLGVSMYGVDMVDGPRGPVVVDVRWFPSFRGMDGAAERLAEHLLTAASS